MCGAERKIGVLEGRTALITGTASGIGEAIAARFRAEGARVAGLDLHATSAGDYNIRVDLRDDAALAEAVKSVQEQFGSPDIVVHAAAATAFGGCLDTPPGTFLDLYDVNVGGAVRLLQAFAPSMQSSSGGSFVMISSINADFATPSLAAYAATKAALNNLVKTAALELAPDNIRVNAIAPASIDTPAMRQAYGLQPDPVEARRRNEARHPIERLGSANEVAELAVFLASDRAGWVTGSIYPIDGGAHVTRR